MFIAEHKLTATGRCPVDGAFDRYEITIQVNRVLPVEEIHEHISRLFAEPIFQEDLTRELALALDAYVITVGHHSSVETTCKAGW